MKNNETNSDNRKKILIAGATGYLGTNYAGKVDALGISDNRDRVGMSALAAADATLYPTWPKNGSMARRL